MQIRTVSILAASSTLSGCKHEDLKSNQCKVTAPKAAAWVSKTVIRQDSFAPSQQVKTFIHQLRTYYRVPSEGVVKDMMKMVVLVGPVLLSSVRPRSSTLSVSLQARSRGAKTSERWLKFLMGLERVKLRLPLPLISRR